jgi:hypothetical protein
MAFAKMPGSGAVIELAIKAVPNIPAIVQESNLRAVMQKP